MAIVTGQVVTASLSTSVVVPLVTVPAGPQTFAVSNLSGATVFIGPGQGGQPPTAAELQSGGFGIANGSVSSVVRDHQAASATMLYVIAASGGSISGPVTYMISTDS